MNNNNFLKKKVDSVLRITSKKKLSAFIPTRLYENIDFALSNLFVKDKKPVVICNIIPWDNFNLLHGIYCLKLKKMIEEGFNCVVIFYDKRVENNENLSSYDKKNLQLSIENYKKWFKNAGLNNENTEYITETILWSFIKFQDFSNKISSFAYHSDIKIDKNRGEIIPYIIENMWEIYYEDLLQSDIVLTGDEDATKIWGMLRKQTLYKNKLSDYTPPIILYFPSLKGLDNKFLNPKNPENSLTTNDNDYTIKNKIRNAKIDFIEVLYDYLIIPYNGYYILNDEKYYSFDILSNKYPIDKLKNNAIDFIIDYLNHIKS